MQGIAEEASHLPPGTAPGTLVAAPNAAAPRIQVISYGSAPGSKGISRRRLSSIEDLPALPSEHAVQWVDITGLGDNKTIQRVGEIFGLHPLALEDVLNVHQRPKVEAYDDHMFIVGRMPEVSPSPSADQGADGETEPSETPGKGATLNWTREVGRLRTEQIAIFVGSNFVVTFQETPGDVFDPVRARMRRSNGRIRARGADYLAYALLDATIDSFFPLLETYGERVEALENDVVERPESVKISEIHNLKRDLLTIRRAVWPQREMLNTLVWEESTLIGSETRLFLRDCYDHTVQLMDLIETYREIASGLVDIQLASVNNRMNEVMKVLTMIATIFIPLTFIAGVYGMNFEPTVSPWNMPELTAYYGYPLTMLAMAGLAGLLLGWFRHKGWLGGKRSR